MLFFSLPPLSLPPLFSAKVLYSRGDYTMARKYFARSLECNEDNLRALYGIFLVRSAHNSFMISLASAHATATLPLWQLSSFFLLFSFSFFWTHFCHTFAHTNPCFFSFAVHQHGAGKAKGRSARSRLGLHECGLGGHFIFCMLLPGLGCSHFSLLLAFSLCVWFSLSFFPSVCFGL